ncbi:MAG: hypothetical protein LBT09_05760 [Planctomycetaceae bacterium]|jgi:hypothetical protein|nr:hypothetical protein [Planctomycetaceae bacterium]
MNLRNADYVLFSVEGISGGWFFDEIEIDIVDVLLLPMYWQFLSWFLAVALMFY